MTITSMPAAPACPPWCREQHNDDTNGWEVQPFPGDTRKRCSSVVRVAAHDRDGELVPLVLERYAFLDDGEVTTEETEFRLAAASLTVEQALRLADAIRALAGRTAAGAPDPCS